MYTTNPNKTISEDYSELMSIKALLIGNARFGCKSGIKSNVVVQ